MKLRDKQKKVSAETTFTDKSSIRLSDQLNEAFTAIVRKPGRAALTALGTIIGVGAFVATTGLATTAQAQVGERFDALKATEVWVQDSEPGKDNPFPEDTDTRLQALNGVNHAGLYWTINNPQLAPHAFPNQIDPCSSSGGITITAATPGAIDAALPTLETGRYFDTFHMTRNERVVVLGSAAAQRLGISRIDNQPAIFLGDTSFTVIGIISDVKRNPDLLLSAIVPHTTATTIFGNRNANYNVLIDVQPGAAQLIGTQAALALRPANPNRLRVLVPPDPKTLRKNVETDITNLFYGLAGLALFIGAVGIANTTLVSVIERRPEIGVRRALGARPKHIAAQFLTETATLGTIGGLVGSAAGILLVVAISLNRQWTTTLNPAFLLPTPLLGTITGILAGLQPALRAARTLPAETLRS
jgi:putative ABC transport system permease protein